MGFIDIVVWIVFVCRTTLSHVGRFLWFMHINSKEKIWLEKSRRNFKWHSRKLMCEEWVGREHTRFVVRFGYKCVYVII